LSLTSTFPAKLRHARRARAQRHESHGYPSQLLLPQRFGQNPGAFSARRATAHAHARSRRRPPCVRLRFLLEPSSGPRLHARIRCGRPCMGRPAGRRASRAELEIPLNPTRSLGREALFACSRALLQLATNCWFLAEGEKKSSQGIGLGQLQRTIPNGRPYGPDFVHLGWR
jgi:hypothetical protein